MKIPWGFLLLVLILLALVYGCSSVPISANPIQDVVSVAPKLTGPLSVTDGFKEAAFNLDNAVVVGALPVDDPAPGCVHDAMKRLGFDPLTPPAPSFLPQTSTLMGQGSVAYIRARQAERASGTGIAVAIPCKILLADILLAAGATGAKILPGGRVLPPLR